MTDTTSTPRLIADNVAALPSSAAERFADHVAGRYKAGGEWREMSYAEAGRAIDEIALGLVELGIEPGDRVCILGNTRVEWTLASYGISAVIHPGGSVRDQEVIAAANEHAMAMVLTGMRHFRH